MSDGKASGDFVVFADGFAGAVKEPGQAAHRPAGLAAGPDGALYISDDEHGRIWRVTYHGDPNAARVAAAPSAGTAGASTAKAESPPEGIHSDAGRRAHHGAPPPGTTPQQVELGDRIFHGEVAGGTCGGCHGSDGRGTPMGADLTHGPWLWSDGTLEGITRTITEGVAHPKQSSGAMPPLGGSQLTPDQVKAVAAYVYTITRQKTH